MNSRVVRIREDALEIAESYHTDLSSAILIMNERIKTLEKAQIDKKALSNIVTGAVSDALADLRGGY